MKTEEHLTNISDPAFQKDQAGQMHLSVELSWDRVSWAVFDPTGEMWVALGSVQTGKLQLAGQLLDRLREVVDNNEVLKLPFAEVRLLWSGLNYTLLPETLIEQGHQETYLQFTNTIHAGEEIATDAIRALQAVNVYAIPAVLRSGLQHFWPNSRLRHSISNMIDHMMIRAGSEQEGASILACIRAQSFDLLIIREKQLLYCNTFEYRTSEDLLYYILFTFEQLKIAPEQSTLMISGDLAKPSQIFDYLEKYIGKVLFMARNPAWKYSNVFDDISAHQFYHLLNIRSCES